MQTKLLRAALLAALSALVLFLAACGDDDSIDLGPDPATMAPADVPIYFEAIVKPDGSLRDDVNSALSKLTGEDQPGAVIRSAIDEELSSDPDNGGITYTDDIEPWIGPRMGFFVSEIDAKGGDAEGAAVVALDDADGAQSFVDKMSESSGSKETDESYNGVEYQYDSSDDTAVGVVSDDFMLIGTKTGFESAVDALPGDSLADDSAASDALGEAPDNALAEMYVDAESLVDLIKSSGEITQAQLDQFEQQLDQFASGPITAWASVTDSSFGLSFSGPADEGQGGPSDLISTFPADSWLAFAASDVGETLQTSLDQFTEGFKAGYEASAPRGSDSSDYDPVEMFKQQTGLDLSTDLTWIGDAGGFVEGTSVLGIGGGLVLEATDEQAATDALDKLEQALSRDRELRRDIKVIPSSNGFSIQAVGAPIGAEVALEDGKVVLAAGGATVDDVVNASATLDGSDRFNSAKDALGEGETPSFFLDFAPIMSLVESSGATDPDYEAAKPYLDALDYVVIGGKLEDDRATGSFVLGVKEGSSDDSDSTSAAIVP